MWGDFVIGANTIEMVKLFSLVWNFEKQDLRKKFKIEEALYTEMFQNFIKNKNVCTFMIKNFNDNL